MRGSIIFTHYFSPNKQIPYVKWTCHCGLPHYNPVYKILSIILLVRVTVLSCTQINITTDCVFLVGCDWIR